MKEQSNRAMPAQLDDDESDLIEYRIAAFLIWLWKVATLQLTKPKGTHTNDNIQRP